MDPALIDDEHLPLVRKSVLPGAGFFYPDDIERETVAELVKSALGPEPEDRDEPETEAPAPTGPPTAVALVDADADGLACVAILRAAHDGEVALVPTNPHEFEAAISSLAPHIESGITVYICDLCPDRFEPISDPLAEIIAAAESVSWFDHHQWDPDIADAVREAGVRLVIGESDVECTADVTLRSMEEPVPDHLEELAVVTRDHDLWIREDDRSDDLADYAHWSEPEEYVETVLEYGPDLPESVHEFLVERRVEKEALIDLAVERAVLKEVGPWTVGVTYGRCSQNEVAEALRIKGADAAVVVKPAGSASIRGSDTFERCHEVAAQVNGGGHPRAAGCKPDIYDDMLDYAHHWTTEGAVAQRVILRAFESLLQDA